MPKTKKTTEELSQQTAASSKEPTSKSVTKKPSSMEELLEKQAAYPPKKGDVVKARIVSMEKRQVFFDIGWKSYAVLGDLETRELSTYVPYLKVGESVPVRVVVEEAKEGYPVVSLRKFFDKGKWEILEEKHVNEEEIEVLCGEYGRGGLFVDFMGIRGVIPKIQLTEEYMNEPAKLYGQKIKVKLLEVDK